MGHEGGVHHDLFTHSDGSIYVLSRELKKYDELQLESWRSSRSIMVHSITILSPEGKELRKVSWIECFLNSAYAPLLEHIKSESDILHTNSIKPILADVAPLFKRARC